MKAGLYGLPFQAYLEPWQLAYKITAPSKSERLGRFQSEVMEFHGELKG